MTNFGTTSVYKNIQTPYGSFLEDGHMTYSKLVPLKYLFTTLHMVLEKCNLKLPKYFWFLYCTSSLYLNFQ